MDNAMNSYFPAACRVDWAFLPAPPRRHLGSQLVEMEKLIDKMMQEDFLHYAAADLNRPLREGAGAMEEVGHAGFPTPAPSVQQGNVFHSH